MSQPPPSEVGVVPVEALRPVTAGWTEGALRALVGPPLEVRSPSSCAGPTEVFESFGFSILDFETDRDLDEVWVYRHDRRGTFLVTNRLHRFVGMRNGIVTGIWRVSRSTSQ